MAAALLIQRRSTMRRFRFARKATRRTRQTRNSAMQIYHRKIIGCMWPPLSPCNVLPVCNWQGPRGSSVLGQCVRRGKVPAPAGCKPAARWGRRAATPAGGSETPTVSRCCFNRGKSLHARRAGIVFQPTPRTHHAARISSLSRGAAGSDPVGSRRAGGFRPRSAWRHNR